MSGTGGVAGRSLASAIICSKVMSVCVHTSTTHTSCGELVLLCTTAAAALVGVRRRTWTTIGSRLMASTTASSCSTLAKPFTWGKTESKQFQEVSLAICHCEKAKKTSLVFKILVFFLLIQDASESHPRSFQEQLVPHSHLKISVHV